MVSRSHHVPDAIQPLPVVPHEKEIKGSAPLNKVKRISVSEM